MDAEPHIGDSAELYAAGVLDAGERASVDAHIERCPACLRRVGEAEETVLALERELTAEPLYGAGKPLALSRRGVAPWWVAVAAAAALIAGVLIPRATPRNDAPTLAMIQSHFSHAQFGGSGPAAKVLYARDRSWYYVIVSGKHRYDIFGVAGGRSTRLGVTTPMGNASELFTRSRVSYGRLELRYGSAVRETAAIR